jgi:molybdopterin-guanine dinucleotide biosynthesis protein A
LPEEEAAGWTETRQSRFFVEILDESLPRGYLYLSRSRFVVANDLEPTRSRTSGYLDSRSGSPYWGSIGGIRTAFISSPHDWVFIKAADMPFLVPELLRTMLDLTSDAHFS